MNRSDTPLSVSNAVAPSGGTDLARALAFFNDGGELELKPGVLGATRARLVAGAAGATFTSVFDAEAGTALLDEPALPGFLAAFDDDEDDDYDEFDDDEDDEDEDDEFEDDDEDDEFDDEDEDDDLDDEDEDDDLDDDDEDLDDED